MTPVLILIACPFIYIASDNGAYIFDAHKVASINRFTSTDCSPEGHCSSSDIQIKLHGEEPETFRIPNYDGGYKKSERLFKDIQARLVRCLK